MRKLQVGQGMVEYVLILVFVALALIASFSFIGNGIVNLLVSNIIGTL